MSRPLSHDPVFPYSPTQEEWDTLSPAQRAHYYASIPQDPDKQASPPEGLGHDLPLRRAREALEHYFRKRGRDVFLANDLRVVYPGEPWFAPDLLAVLDVDKSGDEELPAWVVAEEGRGLDFVLEVHVRGDRRKDESNVERYARLGIPEYFLYDKPGRRLYGWALPSPASRIYQPLLPQHGRLHSRSLDLHLALVAGRLRFFSGTAELPDAAELVQRLDAMVETIEAKLAERERVLAEEERRRVEEERLRKEEERRRVEEERLRKEEQRLRQEAERRIAELEAELARRRGD